MAYIVTGTSITSVHRDQMRRLIFEVSIVLLTPWISMRGSSSISCQLRTYLRDGGSVHMEVL